MEVKGGYKLQIGDRAPDFSLPGYHAGREATFTLSDFAGSKALVVAFWCNHCPYVQAYERRFVDWADQARTRGVGVIAIGSNDETNYPEDAYPFMVERAKAKGYNFPYVRDKDQRVANAYGAQCTPHFLVFDADFRLRYQGRFDDDKDDAKAAKQRYLPEAVDALLAGLDPPQPQSWAIGCSIKWST